MRPFARVVSQITRARDTGDRVASQWKDLGIRIASDMDTGWPTRTGDGVGARGGDEADPTAAAAIARAEGRTDPTIGQVNRFHRAVDAYERAAVELEHATNQLMGLPSDVAYELAERIHRKTASCENCSRVVLNTRGDRLRGGRCSACDEYWRTHTDEHGYRTERPKELWQERLRDSA